jgi:hypothetical protein
MKELAPGDPQRAGKYQLLAELGSGGMGRVFLGRSPGGRLVAVKIIRPDLAGDPGFRARFAREVATARTVSGIFTVQVVDADLHGPQPWLVTAHVDGPSLADAVARHGPVPAGLLVPLAAGLAEGLGAIHAAGVVHRDLKPSNVLLADDGPRIIDFGISRAAGATELTHSGSIIGSPGFMSPEQAQGGEAGPASDIFSLGGVLTFAASEAGPFGTGTPTALLYRVVHEPPDISRLPPPVRELAGRCLAKDQRQRPTTDEILAFLGTAADLAAGWLPWPPRQDAAAVPYPPPVNEGAGAPAPPVPTEPAFEPKTPPAGPPTRTWAGAGQFRGPTQPDRAAAAGPRPPRGGPRLRWALATGVAAAALAAGGAFSVSHWFMAAARSPAATPPAQTGTARTGTAQTGTAQTGTARDGQSAPASPAAAAGSPPAQAWQTYQDRTGFSISLPTGWAVTSRSATEVDFTGTPPGFVVVVAWTTHPRPDALADWRQQAAAKAQADPTYQQISIRRVGYRGYNAADWEFTNRYRGELTHVLDRAFIVQPGRLAYAIELYGPAASWPPVYASMWDRLVASFQLAG